MQGRSFSPAALAILMVLLSVGAAAPRRAGTLRAHSPILRASPASSVRAAPRYEYHTQHDPDGIGKFYMGREIAQVMGHEAADWLDRPERATEEQPDKMLDALRIRPGSVVADIGAGSGYISFRLAKRVGPRGKVFAEEIQPEMLDIIRKRMHERGVSNVVTVLGTESDPRLPPNSTDLILLVDVYHEFNYPYEMARAMVRALKPGGRIAFVEYRLEDPSVPIKLVHKMTVAQVRKEMEPQSLEWVETIETLPRQHIILFRKPPVSTRRARVGAVLRSTDLRIRRQADARIDPSPAAQARPTVKPSKGIG